jgi:hypothetical protein
MTFLPSRPKPGALLLLLCALLTPAAAGAQEPPPPPVDTIPAVRADTVLAADTLPPPPFLRFPRAATPGRATGVWAWDRAALLAETALTLGDLLDRIPGVDVFRTGTFLQPEVAGAFGGTSDRIEIVRDGFVIDPLQSSAVDLATIRLVQLAEVIVERRVDLLRITLLTDEPVAREPYSRVEAGLGQPPVNMFRGVILGPRVFFGPLSAAVERIDTEGRRGLEPADIFETWAKWGYTRQSFGVQAEIRRWTLRRRSGSPWPFDEDRDELVLRARAAPVAGLTTEAYVGRTDSERFPRAAAGGDTARLGRELRSVQSGLRAAWEREGIGGGYAALRFRTGQGLPRTQLDVGARAELGALLTGGVDVTHTAWEAGPARLASRIHASAAPIDALRVFAEAASGSRAAPFRAVLSDDDRREPIGSERTALRGGAEASFGRFTFGAAGLRVETDSVPGFGMPFDSAIAILPGGASNAVEAWGRVALPRLPLVLDGWIVEWIDAGAWSYVPARSWRLALETAISPLPSGNLDVRGRVEARYRGQMLAPSAVNQEVVVATNAYTAGSASLQIRIIDIVIFGRYDNFGDRALGDLPGRPAPGPRFYYGVKWSFWN